MKQISVINRAQEVSDKVFNELFDELVPNTGKASTKAGEIVRAMARLGYKWYNDGDKFGVGYGKQTCNPAGRFLCDKLSEIEDTLWKLYGITNDERYEQGLLKVQNYVIDYILANPQLKEEKNEEDYLNWRNEEEDVDDTEEDYEESLEEEEEW